jgi:hypothetical protein
MISAAIGHLAVQLNQQLKNNFQLVEDIVVVSNLLELDGSVAPHTNNRLVLTLVNIEKDTLPFRPNAGTRGVDERVLQHSAPLFVNLYLMLSANFGAGNYTEALKYVSQAIAFFQQRPMFDQRNSPGLDERIERLILDIENLPIADLNNLWSLLGGRYLPSMYYKVRMVAIDARALTGQAPVIVETRHSVAR